MNRLKKNIGFTLTLFLAIGLVWYFFGNVISHPNKSFFSNHGDGIQHYFQTGYHAKYDTTWYRTQSINYPYGEMIYFTGTQPPIANPIKWISSNIKDISDFTLGIQNIVILLSIIIGALFLYLVLIDFGVHFLLATLGSIFILFLSPQLDRLGGHLSLTYIVFIPLMLYLGLWFNKNWRYYKSLVIFLVAFIMASTHLYFLGFFYFILIFYWGYQSILAFQKKKTAWLTIITHFFIQVVLPYVLISVILNANNEVLDRTEKPWGFLVYRAFPESVFLPVTMPYGRFMHKIINFNYLQWEGIAYIGLFSLVTFGFVLTGIVKGLIKKQWLKVLRVSDNEMLNVFFWASIGALLFSFGVPFVFGLEFLVDLLGPVKQMRGIARFSWVFFYVINILSIYLAWERIKEKPLPYWYVIFTIGFVWFGYDAYLNVQSKPKMYNAGFDLWTDYDNQLSSNQQVNSINTDEYQAILPLPFYHNGSENFWVFPDCDMLKYSMTASLKTGLPLLANSASRTSISQTIHMLQLIKEPYRPYGILSDMPNEKDLLVLYRDCKTLTDYEVNLLEKSAFLFSNEYGSFSRLPVDSIRVLPYEKAQVAWQAINDSMGCEINPNIESVVYKGFNDNEHCGYESNGSRAFISKRWEVLYEEKLSVTKDTSNYVASFWFSPINRDLYPRTRVDVTVTSSNGDVLFHFNKNAESIIKTFDGKWALMEFEFPYTKDGLIKIAFRTNLLSKKERYYVDEFFIRPTDDVYYKTNDTVLWVNNRVYPINYLE